jgi:sugar/nucleoside kinase (ribokinase family)
VAADEVVVIGDLLLDIVVVPDGPLHPGSDTPASVRTIGGGSAANTACWLGALGRPVRLVAAIGDDALGRAALDDLAASGARFDGVRDAAHPTGTCVVLVDERGERTMLPDRGANDALPVAAVVSALAHRPAWVHISGYALFGAGSRPAALAAIEIARRDHIPWSVDAASEAPLRDAGRAAFADWTAGCDVLFLNEAELAALGGSAAALATWRAMVVKRGPAGASWMDHRGSVDQPAIAATIVDTIGAGDAFNGGFVHATLDGGPPPDALRAACEVAARAVARSGARPPLPG